MKQSKLFAIVLFLALQSISALAIEGLSVSGYLKSYPAVMIPAPVETQVASDCTTTEGCDTTTVLLENDPEGLWSNTVRVKGLWKISDSIKLDAAYQLTPLFRKAGSQSTGGALPAPSGSLYRVWDPRQKIVPAEGNNSGDFSLYHNIDRLNISMAFNSFDIIFGRQPIGLGSARIISPADLFSPFSFDTLDTEERGGVDALRARIPIGDLSEIDLGYVAGDEFNASKSAVYSNIKMKLGKVDLSITGIEYRKKWFAGTGIQSSLFKAGVWVEYGYTFVKNTEGADFVRLSAGVDYNFPGDLYGAVEYHFNGAGKSDALDYVSAFAESAYTERTVFFLGKHYLTPMITYQITPLIGSTAQVVFNILDRSAYPSAGFTYNIFENTDISAGGMWGIGKRPNSENMIQSEFGLYPDIYYFSISHYF